VRLCLQKGAFSPKYVSRNKRDFVLDHMNDWNSVKV